MHYDKIKFDMVYSLEGAMMTSEYTFLHFFYRNGFFLTLSLNFYYRNPENKF